MSATLADIAKAANTSISTVSRVLTKAAGARRISEKTRIRIAAVARELGYRPNLLARSLRTRKTHTIAVMVSDIANPWFGQLASLIEQALRRSGYSIIVCNTGENKKLEEEYLRLLPQKGIDGLIAVPLATSKDALYRHLPESTPIVLIDRPVPGIGPCVTSDQPQAAALICDQLVRAGVHKVTLVRGPQHVYTHRIRADLIRSRFGIVMEHEGPAQLETGHAAWSNLGTRSVDAIICTNNFIGQGVLEAMPANSSRTIIGCFDELPLINLLPIPIICSVQDVKRIAESAVEMLLKQLNGRPVSPMIIPAVATWNRVFGTRLEKAKEKR